MGSANDPPESGRRQAADERALDADGLARLQERLDRASEAAERLIAEAAVAAARRPPPAGWQQPDPGAQAGSDAASEPESETDSDPGSGERHRAGTGARFGSTGELELLLEVIGALRDRIPPDLQRRLGEAVREVLLAIRALIDWYLERGEQQRREPAERRDIPIV